MSDETVVIRYEADLTGYAAGARKVAKDLDELEAKERRIEAMRKGSLKFDEQKARLAREARKDRFEALGHEEKMLRLARQREVVEQRLARSQASGNRYRSAALQLRGAQLGAEIGANAGTTPPMLGRNQGILNKFGGTLNSLLPGLGSGLGASMAAGGPVGIGAAGAAAGVYGLRSVIEHAQELDPEMAKLAAAVSRVTGPTRQATEALNQFTVMMSAVGGFAKRLFGNQILTGITAMNAAIGSFLSLWGRVIGAVPFAATRRVGGQMENAGEDFMSRALGALPRGLGGTGGTGRAEYLEALERLQAAQERRRERDSRARAATSGLRAESGFQGSAGLYVTSGGQMMANQSLNIQRNMLSELQRVTRETQNVSRTVRETSYGN